MYMNKAARRLVLASISIAHSMSNTATSHFFARCMILSSRMVSNNDGNNYILENKASLTRQMPCWLRGSAVMSAAPNKK